MIRGDVLLRLNLKNTVSSTRNKKLLRDDVALRCSVEVRTDVVACVSDCGASNMGLWKELGINADNTSFEHPITKNNIYMFADASHLLKLIRNWLLDVGFVLEDKSVTNKTPLQALVSITDTEVRPNWKVSQKHLDCQKSQRQNVTLALLISITSNLI
jgi:hypothetical protein